MRSSRDFNWSQAFDGRSSERPLRVHRPCASRVPFWQPPRLCLHVDTTRTDPHLNKPSHPTPRARDLRERPDSAADEGLSRRRLDDGAFRRFVDDVKTKTDLVALIGRDLDLRPSGSVLKARSPKHRDTDPSFVVWPATQTWHDFSGGGSGGGDCLDYLVQHRGLGFMEALREPSATPG